MTLLRFWAPPTAYVERDGCGSWIVAPHMRWTQEKHTPTICSMQGPNHRKLLGARIRKLRDRKGWSQEEFADICGINRSYMGRIERGELNLTLDSLEKVGKGLGTSVAALLKGIA
jgi:ribosome-binding protein aMBF1 (putative translation factor)